ncbi:phosphoribosylformylglycinamidine cyclo-ligase [Caldalkalibacillus salinus]|uniref:phosphoribosylformylglycinamidine cyclo-ligase n=1 Tax=Caldalkalibacillus salinus TaxID=2803787 RepID=UPI001920A619
MSDAYKQAGVDIHAGYESVSRMKKHVQKTMRPEVLGGLGSFGGMFELPVDRYEQPVLVSGTDGVGTKLKLAFDLDRHDTIGIDAVAMCVNDIIVQGAEPLYFLDYISCGKLVPEKIEDIVAGIANGCAQAGCALVGGETAEMPGFYPDGEYDIAGFGVGVVDKKDIIDGSSIEPGDLLIGLPSSGLHSNGYSLVRKILLDTHHMDLEAPVVTQPGKNVDTLDDIDGPRPTLGDTLLTPTRIYVKQVLALLESFNIKGMAHITGGGFYENIPRMLPKHAQAEIDVGSWPVPDIFTLLKDKGDLTAQDMFNTFNMGIGFVLCVPNEEAVDVIRRVKELGEEAYLLGRIVKGQQEVTLAGVQWGTT